MVETGENLALGAEANSALRVPGRIRATSRKHLDRHFLAIVVGPHGAIDLAHAAAAQKLEQLVGPETVIVFAVCSLEPRPRSE